LHCYSTFSPLHRFQFGFRSNPSKTPLSFVNLTVELMSIRLKQKKLATEALPHIQTFFTVAPKPANAQKHT
jgi:hypothetical protein